MQALALLLLLSTGAAPETARFVFRVQGIPVGVVQLTLDRDTYTYRSVHVFRTPDGSDRSRIRQERRRIAAGRDAETGLHLEGLWLWRRPLAVGCVQGRGELSGRRGPLCVTAIEQDSVQGTVLGKAYAARYDRAGLAALELEGTTFERVGGPPALGGGDPFASGLPIQGVRGPARLVPPARVDRCGGLVAPPELGPPDLTAAAPSETCLTLARRARDLLAARGVRAGIVHGLLLEGQRARPHAWLRLGARDFDPSSGHPVREGHTHLTLGCVADDGELELGELWMRVLGGEHRVVRG